MFFNKKKDEPIWDKETGLLMHYPAKSDDGVVLEPTPKKPRTKPQEKTASEYVWKVMGERETVESFLRRMKAPGHRFKITLDDGLDYVASEYNERSGTFFLSSGGESFHITMEGILSQDPHLTADGGIFIPPASKSKKYSTGGYVNEGRAGDSQNAAMSGEKHKKESQTNGYDAFLNNTGALFIKDQVPLPIAPPELPIQSQVEAKLLSMAKCRCKERVQIEEYGIGTMQYDGKVWVLRKQDGKEVLTRIDNDEISKVCKSFHGNMLYIKNW
jgi:hypothetical protein